MSAQTSFSSRLRKGGSFSKKERVSIIERAKRRAHDSLLGLYEKKLSSEAITVAEIARRIGRDQSRVSRTLNYSSNSTIETLALIAAAMGKDMQIDFPDFASKRNYNGLRHNFSTNSSVNSFTMRSSTKKEARPITSATPMRKLKVKTNSTKVLEDV